MIYAIFATLLLAIRVSAQQWAQFAPTGVGPTSRTYDHVAAEDHAKRGSTSSTRCANPTPSSSI
jgi:hypothetical protein